MADDWCRKWETYGEGEVCTQYKNDFEFSKDVINDSHSNQGLWVSAGVLSLGSLFGFFAFYVARRVKGVSVYSEMLQESIVVGFVLTAGFMLLLGLVFPGPDGWLPDSVQRFRASQVEFWETVAMDSRG